MASRFGRGNSTKASARFEALFRVMVRLCCIRWIFFSADRGQPAGVGEGGTLGSAAAAGTIIFALALLFFPAAENDEPNACKQGHQQDRPRQDEELDPLGRKF